MLANISLFQDATLEGEKTTKTLAQMGDWAFSFWRIKKRVLISLKLIFTDSLTWGVSVLFFKAEEEMWTKGSTRPVEKQIKRIAI